MTGKKIKIINYPIYACYLMASAALIGLTCGILTNINRASVNDYRYSRCFSVSFFFFLIYWRLDRKQFVNRKLTWIHNRQTHVVTIYSLTIYILLCNITLLSPFLHNSLHFWNILQDLSPKFVSFSPLKFPRPTQIQ